jgi:hypothetical protein
VPLSHPAVVLVGLWLSLLPGDYVLRRVGWSNQEFARTLYVTFALAFLATYIGIVIWYAGTITYFDPAEPTITAVAAAFRAGRPLYPAIDAAERYAHVYGPVLFLVHAGALAAFGSSILVSKAVGAAAAIAALAVSFLVYRERAGIYAAIIATTICALVFMAFSNVTFWTRSDPLLILCVALGLFATRLRSRWASMVLLGFTTGVAVNLKVTGILYLLPAFAMSAVAHGSRAVSLAAGLAAITALAPFALPHVSIANYGNYLQLSARNGVNAARLRQNAEWLFYLGLPVAAVLWSARRAAESTPHLRAMILTLAPALVIVTLVAAKPGGGPFHLLPFVPVLLYAVVNAPRSAWHPAVRALALAFAISAVALAIPRQLIFISTTVGRDLTSAVTFIREFADAHPGTSIAVGYTGTSVMSFARPEAVFRTGDYFLDAPAIQEHNLAGLRLPDSTILALTTCRAEYVLTPAGTPFQVQSAYYPEGPREVFPEVFRSEFRKRYRFIRSDVFGVWQCRH